MINKKPKGNQIHVVVTKDFMETADEFFIYCRENGYNASKVIRDSMARWLKEQKEQKQELTRIRSGKKALQKTREYYEKSVLYDR
jgi:hypothetical protein